MVSCEAVSTDSRSTMTMGVAHFGHGAPAVNKLSGWRVAAIHRRIAGSRAQLPPPSMKLCRPHSRPPGLRRSRLQPAQAAESVYKGLGKEKCCKSGGISGNFGGTGADLRPLGALRMKTVSQCREQAGWV
jgi:hypothetical protein